MSAEHPAEDEAQRDGADPAIRWFDVDGERWGAWVGGTGSAGTGSQAHGVLEAIHFCTADAPERTVCRTYIPRGRFDHLFDDELRALRARAWPIPDEPPGSGPGEGPRSRGR